MLRLMPICMALSFFTTILIAFPSFAETPNPYTKVDGSWITIDGTVESVDDDEFVLNYGSGTITVEMDDGDRDADAYKLVKGDKVRVNGIIDDDLFEKNEIEASSVYVENLGTYFFASAVDEENLFANYTTPYYMDPIVVSETIVQGTVTQVDEEEFVIDTGIRSLRIEVEEMPYNPLDDEGYQKIRVGDRVSVAGNMDSDFFEGQRELVADSVIVLSKKNTS